MVVLGQVSTEKCRDYTIGYGQDHEQNFGPNEKLVVPSEHPGNIAQQINSKNNCKRFGNHHGIQVYRNALFREKYCGQI